MWFINNRVLRNYYDPHWAQIGTQTSQKINLWTGIIINQIIEPYMYKDHIYG